VSVVRREALRYIHENGPIVVGDGKAARQEAIPKILDVLNENYSKGTKGSVSYAILELVQARALEEGGTGEGKRFARRKYLGITDVGRRELALRLRQSGSELNDDLKHYVDAFEADIVAEPQGDPIERLRERQRNLDEGAAKLPDADTLEDVAEFDDEHDVSDEIDAGEVVEPQPQAGLAINYDALAQSLLVKVMQVTRDSDQWAAEVERLEQQVVDINRVGKAQDQRKQQEIDGLRDELADVKRTLVATQRERDEAHRLHARANNRIREITAEAERYRGPGGSALRAEDRQKLADLVLTGNLMKEPPQPGPVNAKD
jgi:hypothetical protein